MAEKKKYYIFELAKFLACLMIINSHCRGLYPLQYLAIGGAFGNGIFFILSGYFNCNIKNNLLPPPAVVHQPLHPHAVCVFLRDQLKAAQNPPKKRFYLPFSAPLLVGYNKHLPVTVPLRNHCMTYAFHCRIKRLHQCRNRRTHNVVPGVVSGVSLRLYAADVRRFRP